MSKDWIADLRKIGELRDMGLLTESEFQDEKTRILNTRMDAEIVSQQSTQIKEEDDADAVWETLAGGSNENEIFDVSPYEFQEDERIGSYRILGELGIGGMGVVYRARHLEESWALQQGGDVALKLMKTKFSKDTQFRTRFIREAAVGRSIEHPNVARVHEVVVEGDKLGLVMDLVSGDSLTQLINNGAMSFSKVIKIITPLCQALDHLHNKGIIHRDLKPENIKIMDGDRPVILDFGIAKMDSNEEMTKTGVLMGTVSYMAPEQIDAKKVGPAADRYALGVIVYEMLAGCRPWEKGTSEGRIYTLKLQGALTPLHFIKSDIQTRVSKAVMKMLSTREQDRHPNCIDFLSDLLGRPISPVERTQVQKQESIEDVSISDADLDSARKEYSELMKIIEDLKVDIAKEERNLIGLQRGRDEAIQKAENTIQKIREDAESELESKISSQEQLANDIEGQFDSKKASIDSHISELRKSKTAALNKYKKAKQEHDSGWNSFVSMFSAQKKSQLKTKMNKAKKKLDSVTQELKEMEEKREQQISQIEEEATSRVGKVIKDRESKLASAHNVRDKKIAIANNHLAAAKDKAQSAYEKNKKRIDDSLKALENKMRQKTRRLQTIKASFPQEVWLIKTMVEVENLKMELVQIPSGQFWMGKSPLDSMADDDESPRHRVTLTRTFWMLTTLVTQHLYETVMKENPSKKRGSNRPVESVSWYHAVSFCNRLSELCDFQTAYSFDKSDPKIVYVDLSANGFRLPTEAEWEYAARSEQEFPYAGSDDINQVAWYSANSDYSTKPVGKARHNGYGLYDMSGNVWEWCWDWYGDYSTTDQQDPTGTEKATHRVRRGGAFRNKATHCRVGNRAHSEPSSESSALGFRVVRSIT